VISALWPTFTGAPWEPTPLKRARRMLELAEVQPGETVYDLGCGDGRLIVLAAREFGARAVGVEIEALRYLWCQALITALGLRGQVRVIRGNFFDQRLDEADVVVGFLLKPTNQRLGPKLLEELGPGARVVSYEFPYPEWTPSAVDEDAGIFLYRLDDVRGRLP
jgi:SAM-dependent methyltransferase